MSEPTITLELGERVVNDVVEYVHTLVHFTNKRRCERRMERQHIIITTRRIIINGETLARKEETR